jgi:hypothetical protein
MVSPTIQLTAELPRNEFRLTKRDSHESVPTPCPVQPASAELSLIEQTMNAGTPNTTILTCSTFIRRRIAFLDIGCINPKTRIGGSPTGTPHVDFIATNRRSMFQVRK